MNDQDKDPKNLKSIPDLLKFTLKQILKQKKLWLIPLWILLLTISLIIIFAGGSYILPAIYVSF